MNWQIKKTAEMPQLSNPLLIEGLPGIGNVGKIAVDFMIEELDAKKVYEITSHSLPHSVFVNEDNLVELPKITIYYKKTRNRDLLFLTGDVQPIDEKASYEFCEAILDLAQKHNSKEIITLAGIGLPNIPKKLKIYCTGNSKTAIKRFISGTMIQKNLYGVVGPIVGVSGLLLGLAHNRNINAISLLAETYGHPMYLGIRGSREIVNILNSKLGLKIDIKELDNEVKEIEQEIDSKKTRPGPISKLRTKLGKDTSYIG